MNRYELLGTLGDGAFGEVAKARSQAGEIVAIKKLKKKFATWDECLQLRELKALKKLKHPNIVKLTELVRDKVRVWWTQLAHNCFTIGSQLVHNWFTIGKWQAYILR